MKRLLVACAVTVTILSGCLTQQTATAQGWTELFDGKTLSGWTKRGGEATYAVVDGAIVGTTGTGANTFLCTEKLYGDFELELEVKLIDPLNSGVQIRSIPQVEKKGKMTDRVNGPQVEIEQSPGEAGYIYGEGIKGGWRTPKEQLIENDHFKKDEWNTYRIVAKGAIIQTWINGVQVSDLTDEELYTSHPKGFIALQVHSTKDGEKKLHKVAWKNIRIRER